jgi:ribosomal protein S18 acetylase RimI-like enzyme
MLQLEAHFLEPGERNAVLEHLAKDVRANLMLLDLVTRVTDSPAPGEMRTQVAVATSGSEIAGVAALRPSVVLDAGMTLEALEVLVPFFEPLGIGLVKSPAPLVDALWSRLSRRGRRRALVDRCEVAYSVEPATAALAEIDGAPVRRAKRSDLEPLVIAARESLREESRPDPFSGDVRGFRRWVEGRVGRARVMEDAERIVYVGYADVQRPDGWLLQGIYTWPEARRQGFGRRGTSAVCREAFEAGATHVQLAVVEGNDAAVGLYEGLGFEPFTRLRTILFT